MLGSNVEEEEEELERFRGEKKAVNVGNGEGQVNITTEG